MVRGKRLVVHHSASTYGDAMTFDGWHRGRGFSMIGYHFVILNGHRQQQSTYNMAEDGVLETGRPLDDDQWIEVDEIGAHAKGANRDSVGICLVGTGPRFSMPQISQLVLLCRDLMDQFDLEPRHVFGHREVGTTRTMCPGFDPDLLRAILRSRT